MFSEYVEKQFKKAKFRVLKDGSYFGSVSGFPGVWANKKTLALCKKELREVLEESLILSSKNFQEVFC